MELGGWPSGDEVIKIMRAKYEDVIVAISGGKDSIAMLIKLQEAGFRCHCFHEYKIPDMEFDERQLRWIEERFEVKIMRLPSPDLYRMLKNLAFQPPFRVPLILAADIPQFEHDDVHDVVQEDLGLPVGTYTAIGIRAVDDMVRRTTLKKNGPFNEKRLTFYPIYDMRKDDLVDLLRKHNVKLGFNYQYSGSSFDGLQYRYLHAVKKYAPEDWERIKRWFPLVEAQIIRHENMSEDVDA